MTEEHLRDVLVGSTGFVGSNLMDVHDFSMAVHASNVQEAYGTHPDLLVYAGVPAAMYLANADPEADLAVMEAARENINAIGAAKTVLISSVCVFAQSSGKTERDAPDAPKSDAYGYDRALLERWVRADHPNALIVRLPALYGAGLKKNFIYDLTHRTPTALTDAKHAELKEQIPLVQESYERGADGFWRVREGADREALEAAFRAAPFNALCFTDSRSCFQFYDLARLWSDIQTALAQGWDVLNISVEPLSAGEVFKHIYKTEWTCHLPGAPKSFDMRSIHGPGGAHDPDYLIAKDEALSGLEAFVRSQDA